MVLDDLSTGRRDNIVAGVDVIEGDIRDKALVAELMEGVDGCFHLAAIASVQRSLEEYEEVHSVNQTAAIQLFELAGKLKKPFVYASSAAVYGSNHTGAIEETNKLAPESPYGADKVGCELYAAVINAIYGTPFMGLHAQENLGFKDLRDMWIDEFCGYSQVCYQACDKVITLYAGNQVLQRADGARDDQLAIISNGIDVKRCGSIKRKKHARPTIALIGRVVPIKDIKTFISACHILKQSIRDLRALIIGPMDEDKEYYRECLELIKHEGLSKTIEFTGKVNIDDYLPAIDVQVLTSISEAQPLVLLEVGAMGIPSVATDVGSCREILHGREDESPALGKGGSIVALSNPSEVASAVGELLNNKKVYEAYSQAIKERVKTYYSKEDRQRLYKEMYDQLINKKA